MNKHKIKCFFGVHKEIVLCGIFKSGQMCIFKCRHCGKYQIHNYGADVSTSWLKNIDRYKGLYVPLKYN